MSSAQEQKIHSGWKTEATQVWKNDCHFNLHFFLLSASVKILYFSENMLVHAALIIWIMENSIYC